MSKQNIVDVRIHVDTQQAEEATRRLGNTANQTAEELSDIKEASKEAFDEFEKGAKEATQEVEKLSQEEQKLERDTKSAGDEMLQTGAKGKNAFDGIAHSIRNIEITSIIQQVQFVAEGLGNLAQPAIDFQQSMADLSAITGVVGDDLKDLEKTTRRVGVASGLGASESARAFTLLASQIDVPIEQLKQLQEQSILLAQAGALPLNQAANALAGTINQFGLEAEESTRIINVLAAGSRAGGAEVADLSESFRVVGATAASAGVSVEETAGIIEVLAMNNTKGAEAGTAMRNVLISMQTALGVDIEKTGFVGGLRLIKEKVDSIKNPIQQVSFLTSAFGKDNITAAQYLLSNIDAIEGMTTAVTGSNAAYEQAEIRNSTWAHSLEVIRAKMEDLKIQVVEATGGILPFFAGMAEQMVPLVQLSPLLSSIGGGFSSLFNIIKASPFGRWAAVIGVVAGGLVLLYKNSEDFRNLCNELWNSVKEVAGQFMEALRPAMESVLQALRSLMPMVQHLVKILVQHLARILQQLAPLFGRLMEAIAPIVTIVSEVIAVIMQIVAAILEALMPVIQSLMEVINLFLPYLIKWQKFWIDCFVNVLQTACEWIKIAIDWIKDLFGIVEKSPKAPLEQKAIEEGTNALEKQRKEVERLRQEKENLARTKQEMQYLGGVDGGLEWRIKTNDNALREAEGKLKQLEQVEQKTAAPPTPETLTATTTTGGGGALNLNGKLDKYNNNGEGEIRNRTTLVGLENTISALREKQAKASFGEAAKYQKEIDELQKILDTEKQIIEVVAQKGQHIEAEARRVLYAEDSLQKELWIAQNIKGQAMELGGVAGLTNHINILQNQLNEAKGKERESILKTIHMLTEEKNILKEIEEVRAQFGEGAGLVAGQMLRSKDPKKRKQYDDVKKEGFRPQAHILSDEGMGELSKELAKTISKINNEGKGHLKESSRNFKDYIGDLQDGLGSIGAIFGSINDMLGEGANEWLKWGQNVINVIAQTLPHLATLFQANLGVAASEAGKSQAGIPIVGPLLAAAGVASVVASIVNHPKPKPFADGGIVSGPTYALIGEYAGASNNPEIVAPLDKLQSLLHRDERSEGGRVEFEIKGRKLVGILNKERNRRQF